MWAFILVMVIVLILIAAAVVIPVEFFVVRKQNANNQAQEDLQRCRQQLTCANGGTNVVNQGVCSCTCANGFTGADCTAVDDTSCTTIALGNSASNVTVGDAIPRLIQQAQTNFSIPLSANEVISKLNSGNLSCSAENALVTFDGRSTRQAEAVTPGRVNFAVVDGVFYTTITIVLAPTTTFTLSGPFPTTLTGTDGEGTDFTATFTSGFATTISVSRPPPTPPESPATATSMVTTTMTMSSGAATPTSTFAISEEVLDFARVAVLYILQEDSLADAEAAQMTLQRFFSSGSGGSSSSSGGGGVSVEAARNVTVGGGRSVDLVDFVVDLGGSRGRVGGVSAVKGRAWKGRAAGSADGQPQTTRGCCSDLARRMIEVLWR
jgi:type II secretory pathway pseudopilin PulG